MPTELDSDGFGTRQGFQPALGTASVPIVGVAVVAGLSDFADSVPADGGWPFGTENRRSELEPGQRGRLYKIGPPNTRED